MINKKERYEIEGARTTLSLLAASLLKSLIKGLCVAIGYTHQMVALLVRRRILRIAFFKKKFRITPAILRGLHRLEPEACGLENDGIILAVYEFCS